MTVEDTHLSDSEIDRLIGANAAGGEIEAGSRTAESIERHLVACSLCQDRVRIERGSLRWVRAVRQENLEESSSVCPSERALYEVAAGLLNGRSSDEVVDHVVGCATCAVHLRRILSELNPEVSAEEELAIGGLNSGGEAWQSEFARILESRALPPPEPKRVFARMLPSEWRAWWLVPATCLLAMVGIFAWIQWQSSYTRTSRLLDQAYSEQRTIELRFPGATFGPVRVERGDRNPLANRPAALLEAELIVRKKLRDRPLDPKWLQANGRSELLDGEFDLAAESFERALESEPKSSALLIDLAVAHFESAEVSGSAADYGQTVELLSRALGEEPDNTTALFNRAVVLGKLRLYDQAVDDWNHYLRLDSKGPWAEDARARLNEIQQKIRKQSLLYSAPLLSPLEIASLNRRARENVDPRVEEYLVQCVQTWLPELFGTSRLNPAQRTQMLVGIGSLSELTRVRHSDLWLTDLLKLQTSKQFAAAVGSLSEAARANDRGDYDVARRESARATRLFAMSHNEAGALRARFETVFAFQLSREAGACLRLSTESEKEAGESSYRWLQVQFEIEKAICSGLAGNMGGAAEIVSNALDHAKSSRYEGVYLRATALSADLTAEMGDDDLAWKRASAGLDEFWSGIYRPMAGYNLYTELDTVAESFNERRLEVFILRQALTLIREDPDFLLRAEAYRRLAGVATAAEMPGAAEDAYRTASSLLSQAAQTKATENDRVEDEIWIASLETQRGDLDGAKLQLNALEESIRAAPNRYVTLHFYEAKGGLALRRGEWFAARQALDSAVLASEATRNGMVTEEERIAWERATSATYHDLVKLEFRTGNVEAALELWERYKGSSLPSNVASQKYDSANVELREWQSPNLVSKRLRLFDRASILSYAIFEDGVAIWLWDDRGISARWLDVSPSRLREVARHFTELCADPGSDRTLVRSSGRDLYSLLVTPVEALLAPDRTLILESDPDLGEIPMKALVDREGRYLGERYPIVSSLGLYFQEQLNRESAYTPHSEVTIIAAGSAVGSGLRPLPDVEKEARAIASQFARATLIEDNDATPERVSRAIEHSQVFHFAGHFGSVNGKMGLLLAASNENVPQLFDVDSLRYRRRENLSLVVLSACASALGSSGKSDDRDALVRGFLRVGASHVIASRWSVDSASTTQFMERFYQELLGGGNASKALWRTEASVRSNNATSHPYYWAAFDAFGLE